MIKKKNIAALVLILISCVSCEAKHEKSSQELFIGDCSLNIPYAFNLAVTPYKFITFEKNPLMQRQIEEDGRYEIHWGDINHILTKERETIKSKKKVGNLLVYEVGNSDFTMYYIVGDTFYLESYKYDKTTESLIQSCNDTWEEKPYDKDDPKLLLKDIEKKFILVGNESKYFVNYVFPQANIPIIDTLDKDLLLMKKTKSYLKEYCQTEICKIMINEYERQIKEYKK